LGSRSGTILQKISKYDKKLFKFCVWNKFGRTNSSFRAKLLRIAPPFKEILLLNEGLRQQNKLKDKI
jgi:hypothetical protein